MIFFWAGGARFIRLSLGLWPRAIFLRGANMRNNNKQQVSNIGRLAACDLPLDFLDEVTFSGAKNKKWRLLHRCLLSQRRISKLKAICFTNVLLFSRNNLRTFPNRNGAALLAKIYFFTVMMIALITTRVACQLMREVDICCCCCCFVSERWFYFKLYEWCYVRRCCGYCVRLFCCVSFSSWATVDFCLL